LSDIKIGFSDTGLKSIQIEVGSLLENQFRMDLNTKDKILEGYFHKDFLPKWYFFSNSADAIAHHIFMLTQFLSANRDMISHSSKDGNKITYFVNVGRDYQGRLLSIINANDEMDIVAYSSETTSSGLRIVTLEKRSDSQSLLNDEELYEYRLLKDYLLAYGNRIKGRNLDAFLTSLKPDYIREEISVARVPERILRHFRLFDKILEGQNPAYEIENVEGKGSIRLSIAIDNPGTTYISNILRFFRDNKINLVRSYYNEFNKGEQIIGLFSAYLDLAKSDLKALVPSLLDILKQNRPALSSGADIKKEQIKSRIERLIRDLSGNSTSRNYSDVMADINELTLTNLKPDSEFGNFYLNCLTDFMEGVRFLKLDKDEAVLKELLGFESFEEFFVSCKNRGEQKNVPGYRIRHSRKRGPAKGGLRIDPIADFTEVSALSFMMTWKSARSGILFGGAKGGLMLNARQFDRDSLDFFDSLSNFGRSLFLVTGPTKDVPAGDVGCGPEEIGRLFEGFKSALRDLTLMVYGVKNNVSMIGDQIISIEEARSLLKDAFDIDYHDTRIIRELSGNHKYLELVAASQITGKPQMGIAARNGATGRGIVYATLAAVANLYLDGKWEVAKGLSSAQTKLLKELTSIDSKKIADCKDGTLLSAKSWDTLYKTIFPLLLGGKTVVIQGSGKVGSSIMKELAPFGVNLIAVSDAGGAVIGNNLDYIHLLDSVIKSRLSGDSNKVASVIYAKEGVEKVIEGAREGSAILELECDLLYPAALENAVNGKNANNIKAKIEICGSNGSNSSAAEKILESKGVLVVYDFLANSGGVVASYFEWLRNLEMRYHYEADHIYKEEFDLSCLDYAIMPEFRDRIKAILNISEGEQATALWNLLIRDIMLKSFNEDYRVAFKEGISLKTAGFVAAIKEFL